ncbi:MAG: hypothetical protein IKK70_04995, partial [Clostridia bacterium]|nr:hypothetical protein [Clostridia bacterium]
MRKKLIEIIYKLKLTFLLKIIYRIFSCSFKVKKNNIFSVNHTVMLRSKFTVNGKNNKVEIENDSFLENCNIKIIGNNNSVKIGKNTYANNLNLIIENNDNNINIGENFFVCGNTRLYVVDGSTLSFGNDCMLSDNIEMRTTDNHGIFDLDTGVRINPEKDICIGNHVWIGMGVTVLKGVSISNGCILG